MNMLLSSCRVSIGKLLWALWKILIMCREWTGSVRAGGQVHEQKSREAVQSFYSIQIKLFDRPQASDFSFSLPERLF